MVIFAPTFPRLKLSVAVIVPVDVFTYRKARPEPDVELVSGIVLVEPGELEVNVMGLVTELPEKTRVVSVTVLVVQATQFGALIVSDGIVFVPVPLMKNPPLDEFAATVIVGRFVRVVLPTLIVREFVVLPENANVAVLADKVRLVVVPQSMNPPEFVPVKLKVPEPRFMVRVPVPELFQPFVLIVGLLLLVAKSSVRPMAPVVNDWIVKSVFTVIVPAPELPSIVTVSPEPGTDAPPDPAPDVAAQCVVSEASHVPVPRTQNLLAISYTHVGLDDCAPNHFTVPFRSS